jgi:hypothetical protein
VSFRERVERGCENKHPESGEHALFGKKKDLPPCVGRALCACGSRGVPCVRW